MPKLNELDDRMNEFVDSIRYLTSEISEKNSEIRSSQETLNELREQNLVTPELEQTFSRAEQKYLDEKAELEKKRETIMDTATRELNDAKKEYNKAIDNVNRTGGSQDAEMLSSIRERVVEIGNWEKELQDALNDGDDDHPTIKRLIHRR